MATEGERGERGLDQRRGRGTRTGIDDTAAEAGRGGGEAEAGERERKRERESKRELICAYYTSMAFQNRKYHRVLCVTQY